MAALILAVTLSVSAMVAVAVTLLVIRRRVRPPEGAFTNGSRPALPKTPRPSASFPLRFPTMRSRTALILVFVMLADVAVTAGLAIYFQRENIRQTQLLQREGVVTRATVVSKEIEEDDEGDETYFLTYTFRSNPGRNEEREITRRVSVSAELYWQAEPGGTVGVIYARSEPTVVRFTAGYRPGAVDWLPAILGAALGLPALGFLAWFFILYRRAVRLDEQGVAGLAQVVDKYQDDGSKGSTYYVALQLPDGAPFRCAVFRSLYDRLQVGGQVEVVYLMEYPRIFRLV